VLAYRYGAVSLQCRTNERYKNELNIFAASSQILANFTVVKVVRVHTNLSVPRLQQGAYTRGRFYCRLLPV
jgi:hypothetical protein